MALLDLLGRRWCLRVLWELRGKPCSFRELQGRCDELSPSVLNTRLAELREAGLVALVDGGYGLSTRGQSLGGQLLKLSAWAEDWAEIQPPATAAKMPAKGQRPGAEN